MTLNTLNRRDSLESIVDEIGIRATLTLLAEIADEKRAHIAVNWQDYTLADEWSRAAVAIYNCAARRAIVAIAKASGQ